MNHLILDMDQKGVDILNAVIDKNTGNEKAKLTAILHGGDVMISLLIAEMIRNSFSELRVINVTSCGLIPFLTFPLEKRFMHLDGFVMVHNISSNLDYSLNSREYLNLHYHLKNGMDIFHRLIPDDYSQNIKDFKKGFFSHDIRYFTRKELVDFQLIDANNYFV